MRASVVILSGQASQLMMRPKARWGIGLLGVWGVGRLGRATPEREWSLRSDALIALGRAVLVVGRGSARWGFRRLLQYCYSQAPPQAVKSQVWNLHIPLIW